MWYIMTGQTKFKACDPTESEQQIYYCDRRRGCAGLTCSTEGDDTVPALDALLQPTG